MVLPLDYLDSMMWSIVASGVLLGVAALKLPYKASTDSIEEKGKSISTGLAVALGAMGFYLFITGISINFLWPYKMIAKGVYNVLFGGSASLGGLTLIATSIALYLNRGLKPVSYLASVLGLYLVVDAISILTYQLTREPTFSAIMYLSVAAAGFLSIPATHTDNKQLRWLFAIAAFVFALIWLYLAAHATYGHLQP